MDIQQHKTHSLKRTSRSRRKRKARVRELLPAEDDMIEGTEDSARSPFSALTTAASCTGETMLPFQEVYVAGPPYSEFSSISTPPCTPPPSVMLLSRSRSSAPLTPLDPVEMDEALLDYSRPTSLSSCRESPRRLTPLMHSQPDDSQNGMTSSHLSVCVSENTGDVRRIENFSTELEWFGNDISDCMSV